MAATSNEISHWFDEGVTRKAMHMLIVCDTFDHCDYPVYTATASACLAKFNNPGQMQRVMEVYDLSSDKETQMNKLRCFNLPQPWSAP